MHLWKTQLNFAVWCASSACGVSCLSFSHILSCEVSPEKITDSIATRDQF